MLDRGGVNQANNQVSRHGGALADHEQGARHDDQQDEPARPGQRVDRVAQPGNRPDDSPPDRPGRHRNRVVDRVRVTARLIRPDHESAGKKVGFGQKKIGNAHLRWALGEAVALLVRESDQAKKWLARRQKKSGKGKALGILAAKLGRAIYWMLRRQEPFNVKRFWQS